MVLDSAITLSRLTTAINRLEQEGGDLLLLGHLRSHLAHVSSAAGEVRFAAFDFESLSVAIEEAEARGEANEELERMHRNHAAYFILLTEARMRLYRAISLAEAQLAIL